MASVLRFYKGYTIKNAYAQIAGTAIAATGAATNKLSATAHGLDDGDVVVVTAHATLTLTNLKRYYVRDSTTNDFKVAATRGGTAIAIGDSGTATVVPIVLVELDWANKIAGNTEKDNYDWAGSNQKTHLEILARLSLVIDLDCIPSEAHALIFGKGTISDTLVGGMDASTATGYGGGADKQGATIGLELHGFGLKSAGETTVAFTLWYPRGILALSQPPGLTSGATADKQQYTFSASQGATDIASGAISGLSSDGEYYIFAESAL